jgi:hypothetical protein
MRKYRDKNYLRREYIEKRRKAPDLAEENNVCLGTIETWLAKHNLTNIKSRVKHLINEDKLDLTNPVFHYYAGLIATDGYVDLENNRVSLRLNNTGAKKLLNDLVDYFEFEGEVKLYGESYDLTVTSKSLIKKLKLLSIKGNNKTYDLSFPSILVSDEDCQRMFMRGILDGDGNIHTRVSKFTGNTVGGQFRLVTASQDFIEGVIRFLNYKFSFKEEISTAKVKNVEYPKLEMKVANSKEFYRWVYKGYPKYRLPEKYKRFLLLNE